LKAIVLRSPVKRRNEALNRGSACRILSLRKTRVKIWVRSKAGAGEAAGGSRGEIVRLRGAGVADIPSQNVS